MSAAGEPVHINPADLATHSTCFDGLFESACSSTSLQRLPVGFVSSNEQLRVLVSALYSRTLHLEHESVEHILRISDFLGLACISEACQQYIAKHISYHLPVEVCTLVATVIYSCKGQRTISSTCIELHAVFKTTWRASWQQKCSLLTIYVG